MKTIYLHIGTHKTGTTSLQKLLTSNRQKLLSHGYYYPASATLPFIPGHHMLAWALLYGDSKVDDVTGVCVDLSSAWDDLLAELKSVDCDNFIISAESFSLFSSINQIRKVKTLFSGYEVKINVCLRRQDQYFLSFYQEEVKKGYSKSLSDFIEEQKTIGDYAALIEDWASVFGEDNISVRLFKKTSNEHELFKDFFDQIGLTDMDVSELKHLDRKYNVSPPMKMIKFFRWMNLIFVQFLSLPKSLCWKLYLLPLQSRRPKKVFSLLPDFLFGKEIMTESLSKYILAEFTSVNREVAAKYFTEKEGALF